jgi:hypothetical protein
VFVDFLDFYQLQSAAYLEFLVNSPIGAAQPDGTLTLSIPFEGLIMPARNLPDTLQTLIRH